MVYRIYVEKKEGFRQEAEALYKEASEILKIQGLKGVRLINRYDAEDIRPELFWQAVKTVFSEPQVDDAYTALDTEGAYVFAVEYLPGQFDQRADSAAQCIQLISAEPRPLIASARVYALYGDLSEEDIQKIKHHLINPVESREASLELPETIRQQYDIPEEVQVLKGFTDLNEEELNDFIRDYGLAMDDKDIQFCQQYFKETEKRDPTITEIRMIDTYWSDHCRHTTFGTIIDSAVFEDELLEKAWNSYKEARKDLGREDKPICLMDLATMAVKVLKKQGKLEKLDESEEINACTVKIEIEADGKKEPWLLLFKNETHNHPTEIEPFGGAATCIGGAIRDPLSGRSYVYGAMRLTGAADPTVPVEETLQGKLPQRKLVTTAAQGYSSYGNQIGLATGIVDELYHPGYAAKHMEVGAVIAAAPQENVRREVPAPGDVVILLGGRTGRDGIGGATGSSKAHTVSSVETCGAEVQKGNAPEERKLQRLFRNPEACRMIKRCNDFGAGGVSVAIGELADGLDIDLNVVPKKYDGLDGTELAISESQERMAVVVEEKDYPRFLEIASEENLEATIVATVKEEKRLTMTWNDKVIVDVSREFLNSNGAEKHIDIAPAKIQDFEKEISGNFREAFLDVARDLNSCSKRGLSERFDSTIGRGTVLMPFGGKNQRTPIQAMVQKISTEEKYTEDCSLMSWGYNPMIAEKSPYHSAYLSVVDAVSKLIATGASFEDVYLTMQEYFEKPQTDPKRWGKPLAALLGAYEAQLDLGCGAIGGKDSMSGSFEDIDVPPTLITFAVTTGKVKDIVSDEFKKAGNRVYMISPEKTDAGLPDPESLKACFSRVTELLRSKKAVTAYTPCFGGVAEAVMKMAFGNGFGFAFNEALDNKKLFGYQYGSFLLETAEEIEDALYIGKITEEGVFSYGEETVSYEETEQSYEDKLESVYPCNITEDAKTVEAFTYTAASWASPRVKTAKPRVLIPVFPGTNCEYDSAKAVREAGMIPEIFVINNLTPENIKLSTERFAEKLKASQMLFIPGGFSGGDEPDGSAKFITAFFRNEEIKNGVHALLDEKDGLILGICNGFQALVKLGLVPFGRIVDTDENCPTLTFNSIARHQSKIVRTRIASNLSPFFKLLDPGDIISVPISHGEGRFIAPENMIRKLAESGQIATQYVDLMGDPTYDVAFNPNNSMYAIEGITSPDGRILGKMGHSERFTHGLYKNVPGSYDSRIFEAAAQYFNHI